MGDRKGELYYLFKEFYHRSPLKEYECHLRTTSDPLSTGEYTEGGFRCWLKKNYHGWLDWAEKELEKRKSESKESDEGE